MKFKNQKIKILIGLLCGIVLSCGISYAYWMITKEQTTINKVLTGCLDLSLTEEKNTINLTNAYPITDEEGKKLIPYSFKITNTCDLFASYTVNLEMLEGTTLNSRYIKVMVNKEQIQNLGSLETTETSISNSKEARRLASGSLGSGDSEEYSIRLWMDGSLTTEDKEAMNKKMLSKVVVTATPSTYNPVDNGITLLKDAILANEYQTTNIESAKEKIASKQAVDFSKTAPIIDWQENHSNSISTLSYPLPAPSLVGSGIEGTEELTAENILPMIATGYEFDREKGKYILTSTQRMDPSSLDFNNNDYYVLNCSLYPSDGVGSANCWGSDFEMLKVKEVSKSEVTITGGNGIKYEGIKYTYKGYKYTPTEVENDKSDKGIYQMKDNYGTSYYYRGNVFNNNVLFGGFYWKIIRINSDDSIRLIYNGTTPNATGNNTTIGVTKFNILTANPAYVGYMYGNTLNSSYEQTHANENDSNMKKYLDNWYLNNIENKGLSNYIADSGFCNDRSLSDGDGVSANTTSTFNSEKREKSFTPSLICQNKNDLFTVNNDKGNKALTYPIGLITSDELMLAGINYGLNPLSFLSGSNIYTMSPIYFDTVQDIAVIRALRPNGAMNGVYSNSDIGVRPVINLKADTEISGGIGTINEPFVVK